MEIFEGEEIMVNKGILNVKVINRFAASKPQNQQAQASRGNGELEKKVRHLTEMLHYQLTQQRNYFDFTHNVYQWQKKIAKVDHPKLSLAPPPFPMQLLAPLPFEATPPSSPFPETEAPITEPENAEDSMEWCPPPPSRVHTTVTTKKGKEPQQPKSVKKTKNDVVGSSGVTPSEQETNTESTQSHQPVTKTKARAVQKSPDFEEQATPNPEEEEEVAITKEVKGTGKRTLQEMVNFENRRLISRLKNN